MGDNEKQKTESVEYDPLSTAPGKPLFFISHDSRDAELAEAFSKLLKSVSTGMLKTFRFSDKKGKEGIDFGEEWYKTLMSKLDETSGVVCIFTERSLERPWILFEAGVAKGKLNIPVLGIAMGVPLSRVSTGPFYQFQNCDDSEDDLKKLIHQLAQKSPGLELDTDVVKTQLASFKESEQKILEKLSSHETRKGKETEENPVSKLVEEMKALPSRVAERLSEKGEPFRRRRQRRFHPMMFDEIAHMIGPNDPVGILVAASLIKDDAPWLYELAMEVYKAVKYGDTSAIKQEMKRLMHLSEFLMHGPFMEEFGVESKETYMFLREFPRIIERMLPRPLEEKKPASARKVHRVPEE